MPTASELIQQLDILKQKIADSLKAPVVTVSHTASREGDILSVAWSLNIKGTHAGLVINVEHSNTATGGIEKHAWSIPAGATEHGSKFPYKYFMPGITFADVRFRVLPGEGYTVGTPAEAIERLTAAPTPQPVPTPTPPPVVSYKEPVDVYPKPFTTNLKLRIVAPGAQQVKVTLINDRWKTYFSGYLPVVAGVNNMDIGKYLTGAPAGEYTIFCKMVTHKLETFKVMKT